MSSIRSVVQGAKILAEDINQLVRALSQVLSITDDAQTWLFGQAQRSADIGTVDITDTSMVDVTGLSVSITTRGGRLRISLVSENTDGDIAQVYAFVDTGTPATVGGIVRAVVGATNLGGQTIYLGGNTTDADWQIGLPPSAFVWDYVVAAGTYTVKIQAMVDTSAATVRFENLALLVEELPYA